MLLLAVLFNSCRDREDLFSGPDFEVETIIPTGDEAYLNRDSDYLFDQDKLATFELNIPGSSLSKINDDPAAEEYVEASLTFEGETISPVGVRYKGSLGSFSGCLSGINFFNPSGHKTCTKLNMKIKINWEGREDKFYGVKKLQFHAMNNDPSQMRERMGYWFYREMGVPAPRCVHARLLINGQFAGVFALVEQIDGRFARYNFEDGEGNVYKELWPLDHNGQLRPESDFLEALKTNEDDNPSVDLLRSFGEEIQSQPIAMHQDIVRAYMDVDKIISYAVVDRAIKNDDGVFKWYCFGGIECSNHNFYWYEETQRAKVHLIPWDLDIAFQNWSHTESSFGIQESWGEIINDCEPYKNGLLDFSQRSAACDLIIRAWTKFEDEFADKMLTFKQGPFSLPETEANFEAWSEQIRLSTEDAALEFDDAISIDRWENGMDELRNQIAKAREAF